MSHELTKEQIEKADKAWSEVIAHSHSRASSTEDYFKAIAPHLQYQAQTSAPTPHRSCCAWALDAEQDKKTIASLQGKLDGWLTLCKEYACHQTPEALEACFARQRGRLEAQIKTLQERLSDQTQRANQFGREARERVPAKIAPISIDSAPTDGTSILGWSEEYGWRETRKHQYLPNSIAYMNGERFGGWEWLEEVHNSLHTWKPTHWLPLPDNPNPDPRKARIVERIQRGGGAEVIAQWILDNELAGLSAEGKVDR